MLCFWSVQQECSVFSAIFNIDILGNLIGRLNRSQQIQQKQENKNISDLGSCPCEAVHIVRGQSHATTFVYALFSPLQYLPTEQSMKPVLLT